MTTHTQATILNTLTKYAKEDPEGHHLRRYLLSNPISTAIESESGKKTKGFGEALGHNITEQLAGIGKGMTVGSGLGALGGIAKLHTGGVIPAMASGAILGAHIGGLYGFLKGQHGSEASRIHGKHSKHRKNSEKEASFYKAVYKQGQHSALEKLGFYGWSADAAMVGVPSAVGYGLGRANTPISDEEAKEMAQRHYNLFGGAIIPGYTGYHFGEKHTARKHLATKNKEKKKDKD